MRPSIGRPSPAREVTAPYATATSRPGQPFTSNTPCVGRAATAYGLGGMLNRAGIGLRDAETFSLAALERRELDRQHAPARDEPRHLDRVLVGLRAAKRKEERVDVSRQQLGESTR